MGLQIAPLEKDYQNKIPLYFIWRIDYVPTSGEALLVERRRLLALAPKHARQTEIPLL